MDTDECTFTSCLSNDICQRIDWNNVCTRISEVKLKYRYLSSNYDEEQFIYPHTSKRYIEKQFLIRNSARNVSFFIYSNKNLCFSSKMEKKKKMYWMVCVVIFLMFFYGLKVNYLILFNSKNIVTRIHPFGRRRSYIKIKKTHSSSKSRQYVNM